MTKNIDAEVRTAVDKLATSELNGAAYDQILAATVTNLPRDQFDHYTTHRRFEVLNPGGSPTGTITESDDTTQVQTVTVRTDDCGCGSVTVQIGALSPDVPTQTVADGNYFCSQHDG
jgi:hypothetical protein